jgi:hypothetical protein
MTKFNQVNRVTRADTEPRQPDPICLAIPVLPDELCQLNDDHLEK